jgi:hypothetical protein
MVLSSFILSAGLGCGSSDPNSNLKSVDKNVPLPSATDKSKDGKTADKKAPPVLP